MQNVRIGKPAITAKQSLQLMHQDQKQMDLLDAKAKQQRALQDFFRDTGGKITDLRVLRSAMFLSDEIDRAVRGTDEPNQFVGWRKYNRFFAQGTEDMFTNIPTGKSPLVMASPKSKINMLQADATQKSLPLQYQAQRKSHLKQVGKLLDQVEQAEMVRLANDNNTMQLTQAQREYIERKRAERENASSTTTTTTTLPASQNAETKLLIPKNDKFGTMPALNLKQAVFQPYDPQDGKPLKQRLYRFEGELNERRPDLDYKFE